MMTKEKFMKYTGPFRGNEKWTRGLHILNRILTAMGYVSYPFLLIYLIWTKDVRFFQALLVPGISFMAVTLFRAKLNAPRPYEVYEEAPLIPKETRGHSFPSRHVFSIFIIAMTFLLLSPWTWFGIVLLAAGVFLAVVRVLTGVHFPRDVIAGALFAVVVALVFYSIDFGAGSHSKSVDNTEYVTEAGKGTEEFTKEEPATEELATEELATEELATEELATEETETEESATEEATTNENATGENANVQSESTGVEQGTAVAEPQPPVPQAPVIPADDGIITVCLDPGHGGSQSGCTFNYDGVQIYEKNLNLTIALKVRDYLTANGIRVIMTRSDDTTVPSLSDRVDYGFQNGADYFVSLHNNSSSTGDPNHNGSLAIVTTSHYIAPTSLSSDVYGESWNLAASILGELQGIGIPFTTDWNANENSGMLQRPGTSGDTYEDGSNMDYYGIINSAMEYGIPATIIEHAFLSNESDYRNYFSSDEQLDALAQADARGILNYLASR